MDSEHLATYTMYGAIISSLTSFVASWLALLISRRVATITSGVLAAVGTIMFVTSEYYMPSFKIRLDLLLIPPLLLMTWLHCAALAAGGRVLRWFAVSIAGVLALVGLFTSCARLVANDWPPLFKAASHGQTEEVRRLIKEGVDVNEGTGNGETPLMAAAWDNRIEVARILIEHGADVNAIQPRGSLEATALMIAARYGRIKMMKLLIEHGADVNARSPDGYTVLQRPARNGETEAVKLLIEHGADVNTSTGSSTALGYASNEAIKKLLIDAASKPGLVGKGPVRSCNRPAAPPASPARPSAAPPAQFASTAPSIAAMSPGATFRDCEVCPEMVVIPSGSFMMGWPEERLGVNEEKPRHQVTISRAFAAGKYEVTFDEWGACVREGGCNYNPSDQGWGRGKRPVINVPWQDAKAYAEWLSRKTGRTYRLLIETEWEYVARAGTTTAFSFGSSITPQQANYNTELSYAGSPVATSRRQTLPVGSFTPNAFGLHDVHGNASEWTENCVLHGGSWLSGPVDLRSSARDFGNSVFGLGNIGVRVARTE